MGNSFAWIMEDRLSPLPHELSALSVRVLPPAHLHPSAHSVQDRSSPGLAESHSLQRACLRPALPELCGSRPHSCPSPGCFPLISHLSASRETSAAPLKVIPFSTLLKHCVLRFPCVSACYTRLPSLLQGAFPLSWSPVWITHTCHRARASWAFEHSSWQKRLNLWFLHVRTVYGITWDFGQLYLNLQESPPRTLPCMCLCSDTGREHKDGETENFPH